MQQRRREVWTRWRALIAEQDRSGLSITAFCRDRGVPISQFFAWKKRLRQSAAPSFVAVQVIPALSQPAPSRAIEVSLAGGRRLFVEPGFDPDHLRALVAALEAQA